MKLKKLIRFILIIIILILLFTIIRSTYSKYVTAIDKNTGVGLNAWNIKVNDERITTDANFTNNLKVVFDANPNIAPNTIAPTRTGTVSLTLDSTGTQVPYEYKVEIVDGDVDYESSYFNTLNNFWGNSSQGYTYETFLTIDYSHIDQPIWYDYTLNRHPWWGHVYNPIEVELILPEGFSLENSVIYNVDNLRIEGSKVTFTPKEYLWQTSTEPDYTDPNDPGMTYTNFSNNILKVQLHLHYDSQVDVETEDFWQSLSLDGKKILKSNLPDYRIYAYSLNGGEKVILDDTITEISGIIQPASDINTEVKNDILLYVEWYDGPDNIMDNAADVEVTQIDNPYGTVPIGVFVTQVYE